MDHSLDNITGRFYAIRETCRLSHIDHATTMVTRLYCRPGDVSTDQGTIRFEIDNTLLLEVQHFGGGLVSHYAVVVIEYGLYDCSIGSVALNDPVFDCLVWYRFFGNHHPCADQDTVASHSDRTGQLSTGTYAARENYRNIQRLWAECTLHQTTNHRRAWVTGAFTTNKDDGIDSSLDGGPGETNGWNLVQDFDIGLSKPVNKVVWAPTGGFDKGHTHIADDVDQRK